MSLFLVTVLGIAVLLTVFVRLQTDTAHAMEKINIMEGVSGLQCVAICVSLVVPTGIVAFNFFFLRRVMQADVTAAVLLASNTATVNPNDPTMAQIIATLKASYQVAEASLIQAQLMCVFLSLLTSTVAQSVSHIVLGVVAETISTRKYPRSKTQSFSASSLLEIRWCNKMWSTETSTL